MLTKFHLSKSTIAYFEGGDSWLIARGTQIIKPEDLTPFEQLRLLEAQEHVKAELLNPPDWEE